MNDEANQSGIQREEFPDGSALVTYPDGSQLILESSLARASVIGEHRAVNYGDPAPPPPAPIVAAEQPGWIEVMGEVWQAQKDIKADDRVPSPAFQKRQRRRR